MKPSLRVLIVEDSEFDAQMIVSMLRKGGYDVTFQRVVYEDPYQPHWGFSFGWVIS